MKCNRKEEESPFNVSFTPTQPCSHRSPRPRGHWSQMLMGRVSSVVPQRCHVGVSSPSSQSQLPGGCKPCAQQCLVTKKETCLFSGCNKPVACRRTRWEGTPLRPLPQGCHQSLNLFTCGLDSEITNITHTLQPLLDDFLYGQSKPTSSRSPEYSQQPLLLSIPT